MSEIPILDCIYASRCKLHVSRYSKSSRSQKTKNQNCSIQSRLLLQILYCLKLFSKLQGCIKVFCFSGFCFLYLPLSFILFQGWKWSSTGLLPVCVLGAVRWIARDIQVSKPVAKAAGFFVFFSSGKASGEVCKEWPEVL